MPFGTATISIAVFFLESIIVSSSHGIHHFVPSLLCYKHPKAPRCEQIQLVS